MQRIEDLMWHLLRLVADDPHVVLQVREMWSCDDLSGHGILFQHLMLLSKIHMRLI